MLCKNAKHQLLSRVFSIDVSQSCQLFRPFASCRPRIQGSQSSQLLAQIKTPKHFPYHGFFLSSCTPCLPCCRMPRGHGRRKTLSTRQSFGWVCPLRAGTGYIEMALFETSFSVRTIQSSWESSLIGFYGTWSLHLLATRSLHDRSTAAFRLGRRVAICL
jgi:hypothetical protein